ncbi:Annexin-B9 [Dactylella cylindrospora]|nr:Annexin-B9 [Dactylella cylindrospora]
MSYSQYPGGYGMPGGQPPPGGGGYGYQQPGYGPSPGPQGYTQSPPTHQSSFPPFSPGMQQPQSGGSASQYYNPTSQPSPYGQAPPPVPPHPSGYPQPDYNANRSSFQAPPGGMPQNGYPMTPNSYAGAPPVGVPQSAGPAYPAPYAQPWQPQPYGAAPPQPWGQQYPPSGYPPSNYPPQPQATPYAGAPMPPSPGYEEPPMTNPMEFKTQADCLRRAMKGIGTNEAELIRVLSQLSTPFAIHSVVKAFSERHGRDLLHDLKSETSGHFEDALLAVARGPLQQDVHALYAAIHRPGTKESILNDVLLGRTPADLAAIVKSYQRTFARSLEADVRGDLSMKTEDMFVFALQGRRAEDNVPVDIRQSEKDAYNIQMAIEGAGATGVGGVFSSTYQEAVYSVLLSRNDAQIGAIAHSYERMYNRRLDTMIEKKFSGHMEQALLYVVRGGTDKALRDAMLLEDAMKGVGTKDALLIHRIVKYRWNKAHFANVKRAYYDHFRKTLEDAVYSETSGDYRKFMIALITSS